MIAELSSIAQALPTGGLRAGDDSMKSMSDEKPPMRIAELADQCVQCGLCLPVCPTYALDANEVESPRGRIALAAALARGQVEASADLRIHLDHCLGCLNCQKVCPAHVKYDDLLVQTRALLGAAPERPTQLLEIIKRPAQWTRWRRIGQWTAFDAWKGAVAPILARPSLRNALAVWPKWPLPARHQGVAGTVSADDDVVALFPGCIASVEDRDAQAAATTLLSAAGYRVVELPAFCCGAMDLHDGATSEADRAAAQVRAAWQQANARYLVSVTPGCIGTLRHALPEAQVVDPLTLLADRIDRLDFRPLEERVALHIPCTQYNVTRSDGALLALLRKIPGLDVQALPRPPHCCGAAGSHMLTFPERAATLRDQTLRQVAALAADRVLSSNIGCRMHLASGMDADAARKTQHPLVMLAQQLIAPRSP